MINTRKNEIAFSTSDPKEMLGKYVAKRVLRKWTEDFADEDTGEIVSVERNEIIIEAGSYIDKEALATIEFFLQEGSVKEIAVSNQKRVAFEVKNESLYPYMVKVTIGNKNYNILAYALNIKNLLEIVKDYVELNFHGFFVIESTKRINCHKILIDNLLDKEQAESEENTDEKKYYKIGISIYSDDELKGEYNLIVNTYNVDKAMMLINTYIQEKEHQYAEKCINNGTEYVEENLVAKLEEVTTISVNFFIPYEFSEAYKNDE